MDFNKLWKELIDEDFYETEEFVSTPEEMRDYLENECGEGGSHGYGFFISDYTEALHIERIDELGWYDSDIEAAKQAELDGVKIIHDIDIPQNSILRYYKDTFIDTPDNRAIILKELKTEIS